ncbi:MAG: S-methyl-5-thioribose-1-phosphate isomerase [Candidatus Methanomethylicota archaeon]|uniref:Putative methylthioribose-1-phosphate isomerase n=1 Tax=Thermoproteota archaeon TaxID=2056631 RepID=A0A497F051_9CREN|nr:MAG: S-methyl-5-thioribose-1-phosphate isomerase [Candidatus Verstraetearchaeota archaeon]
MRTIEWKGDHVLILDQAKLPLKLEYLRCESYEDVAKAIEDMNIRGAPAIGVAAAMGLALAVKRCKGLSLEKIRSELYKAAERLRKTRPTAVNLFWSIDRVLSKAARASSSEELVKAVEEEALLMAEEDVKVNLAIGDAGAELIDDGDGVMTHCNAGALACVGYGTALGIIRSAVKQGKRIRVFACETRPLLQGARLTAFELMQDGIPVTLITDNMAGYVMSKGLVNKVVVGADRVLSSGHVINKIGTYSLSILAKYHKIPFIVAAPTSSFDLKSRVEDVVIEHRSPKEVTHVFGVQVAPNGVEVLNPAFDITPPENISHIVTERGVIGPPFEENILRVLKER